MRIVGPAIGGLLIATLGFNWNFFIEATAYVIIVLVYMPMKLPYREERSTVPIFMIPSMSEGLAYVVKERTTLQLIVMAFIPNLVSSRWFSYRLSSQHRSWSGVRMPVEFWREPLARVALSLQSSLPAEDS